MTPTFLRPDASFSEASSPSIIPNFATIWMARSWLHQNRFLARKFTQIQIAKIPIVVLLGRTACGWAARRCLKAGWRSEPSTAALRFCPTGLVASLSHTQKKISFLHPAGLFQFLSYSLRSKTILPCTRFADTPEAPFSLGLFIGLFISLIHFIFFGNAALSLLFEAAAQSAAAAGRAGDARWRGAARGNKPSWPGE